MFCHSTGCLRNRGVSGDFHRPYETQKILGFTIQRRTLPQSASLTAPSGREPGWGAHHSSGCLRNRKVTGDFHRPYETQKILAFTIHRSTLPQSASLTAPSEREPGRGAYHSLGYSLKSRVTGDFHRPYERAGAIHCSTCPLCVQFSFPGCRSLGGFWTASSRSPGTCRPGFPWPPSGALPGSWWGRRSRWRCRRGGGGR